jgi:hypothetical protein
LATKKFPQCDKHLAQTAAPTEPPFLLLGAGFWQKAGNPGVLRCLTMPRSFGQVDSRQSDASVAQRMAGSRAVKQRSWAIGSSYRPKTISCINRVKAIG